MTRQNRMDRNQFFQLLSGKGDADLKKALWDLYWRGKAELRERIEDLLAPTPPSESRKKDPALMGDVVLHNIKAFGMPLTLLKMFGTGWARPKHCRPRHGP